MIKYYATGVLLHCLLRTVGGADECPIQRQRSCRALRIIWSFRYPLCRRLEFVDFRYLLTCQTRMEPQSIRLQPCGIKAVIERTVSLFLSLSLSFEILPFQIASSIVSGSFHEFPAVHQDFVRRQCNAVYRRPRYTCNLPGVTVLILKLGAYHYHGRTQPQQDYQCRTISRSSGKVETTRLSQRWAKIWEEIEPLPFDQAYVPAHVRYQSLCFQALWNLEHGKIEEIRGHKSNVFL